MGKFVDHKIKYRTLDQLFNTVSNDWPSYDLESLVDPSQLIKVVRKINKQLGLRITKTKEIMLEFDNYVINLPDDMEQYNFGVRCNHYSFVQALPQGVQQENVTVDCTRGCKNVFLTPCGETYVVVQTLRPGVPIHWHIHERITISHKQLNMPHHCLTGVFLNDNFMRLNLKCGTVYLNYEGILEDDDGNILVLDHPMVNDYYEYAIKERIMENMYFEGEDVQQKLGLLQQKLQMSKREAYNVANLQEFQELQEVNEINRKAMYKKYYSVFL